MKGLLRWLMCTAVLGPAIASAAAPTASAASVQSAPQGNWVGTYGASGYDLAAWSGSADLTSLPGATVALTQGSRYLWAAGTTDPRALESADQSTRNAATYYDPNQLRVKFTFSGAFAGNVHLYALDWDGQNRRETIAVDDGSGPQNTQLHSDFSQGIWVAVPIHVPVGGTLTITATNDAGPNAVLSGIMLDDGGGGSSPQGNWAGTYGVSGYDLAGWNGSTDLTSMVAVSLLQGNRYLWAAGTTDPRALESADQSTRNAATYYDPNELRVKLAFSAPFAGNLHLYAVDWDTHDRRETITVNDGSTSQTATLSGDFNQGAWISAPISVTAGGTVTITVDEVAGANAVLSGIFLGDAGPPPPPGGPPPGSCVPQSGPVAASPFLIGVWQQPDDSFATWRSRGINTIVDDLNLQTSDPFATWEQKLACQDLFAIRQPQQSLAQENADPRLLALAQTDEPDVANTPPAQEQATYSQWKAGAPSKPVFVNFSGANIYEAQSNPIQGSRHVWAASSSDMRALESPDQTARSAATYFDSKRIFVQLKFSAAFAGNLHLYAVDWDLQGRREMIAVDDGSGPQSASLNSDFSQGEWVGVGVHVAAGGTLTITVTRTAGPNAVLSGIFLDKTDSPAGEISSPQLSSLPQGNWVGTYGGSGYDLAAWSGSGDLASIPGVSIQLGQTAQQLYAGWMSAADWISNDIYPVSGYNRPDWIDLTQTAQPPVGYIEDQLATWSGGKPQYQFVEASNQTGASTFRAPTADEFRGEIWDAIIHGARGVIYYPQSGNQDDGVAADLVTEMSNQDATISRLAPLLVSPGRQQSVPGPFESARRTYCGVAYTLTLNFSHDSASYLGSTFGPYQLQISPAPPNPLPSC